MEKLEVRISLQNTLILYYITLDYYSRNFSVYHVSVVLLKTVVLKYHCLPCLCV